MAQVDFLAASEGRLSQDAFRIDSFASGNWVEGTLNASASIYSAFKSLFPPVVQGFCGDFVDGFADADSLGFKAAGAWAGVPLVVPEVASFSAFRYIGDYRAGSPTSNHPSYFWG